MKKIIIRMPNWLGDFIMALPTLAMCRDVFSRAHITVMCPQILGQLLKGNIDIDDIFVFEKTKFFSKEQRSIIKKIKIQTFDVGILLTNSFSSAYLFWRAGVKTRIGYNMHFRGWMLNHSVSLAQKRKHLVEIYEELVFPNREKVWPKLVVEKEDLRNAEALLEKKGYVKGKKIVGINAYAAYGPAKCWPAENFRTIARKLIEDKDVFVFFTGDSWARHKIEEITKDISSRVVNLAGMSTLPILAALIRLCDCFLTNDSGPMHLAAAVNAPLVALFGSTDPLRTGPYGKGMVITKNKPCSPCFKRMCKKGFSCMRDITVEEVFMGVKKVLYAEKNN